MLRHIHRLCIVLLLLLPGINTAIADEKTAELLVVRPEGSWPPLEMIIDGEPAGIHIELVREAGRILNIPVRIESYPWKRAVQMFKQGKADAITYMAETEERKQFAYFEPGNLLSRSSVAFFILKKREDEIHFTGEFSSLQDHTIGRVLGFSYDEAFDQADYLQKDSGVLNETKLIKMLLTERVPVAIGHVDDIKYLAKQMGVAEQIKILQPYVSDGRGHYIAFAKAKGHDALAKRFAEAMAAFKQTDQYSELLKKYGIEQ